MPTPNPYFEAQLQIARQSIDTIDHKLIELLSERSACVANIAEIKCQTGHAPYDAERESHIIDSICKKNPTHYQRADLEKIFRAILRAGLNQQLLQRADIYTELED